MVNVKLDDGLGDEVIPRTINEHNSDPIPNIVRGNSNHSISDYIRVRDPSLQDLSVIESRHLHCLKYHCSGVSFDTDDLYSKQDCIGKLLLDDNPDSANSLLNLVHALMVDNNVKTIVKDVTGSESVSALHALAYFVGQLSGIELSESSISDDEDIDLHGLLNDTGHNDSGIQCAIANVFMLSAMTARTKKMRKFDPSASLYDSRSRPSVLFSNQDKVQERKAKLKTALAAIHASQSETPPVSGPSSSLISHGIK